MKAHQPGTLYRIADSVELYGGLLITTLRSSVDSIDGVVHCTREEFSERLEELQLAGTMPTGSLIYAVPKEDLEAVSAQDRLCPICLDNCTGARGTHGALVFQHGDSLGCVWLASTYTAAPATPARRTGAHA